MRSQLADLFYKNAAETPDKQAIWCDGKTATYKEMADLVSRYSNFLVSKGVQYGDHVAIPMNNSIESVALFFTAADLGVCLVPLNPTLPLESIKTAMQSGDMKHLIARKSFLNDCEKKGGVDVPGIIVCLDGEYEGAYPFSEVESMPTTRPAYEYIKGDTVRIVDSVYTSKYFKTIDTMYVTDTVKESTTIIQPEVVVKSKTADSRFLRNVSNSYAFDTFEEYVDIIGITAILVGNFNKLMVDFVDIFICFDAFIVWYFYERCQVVNIRFIAFTRNSHSGFDHNVAHSCLFYTGICRIAIDRLVL